MSRLCSSARIPPSTDAHINAYGLTMDKAIQSLATRQFGKGETVYDFASDIRNNFRVCLPALSEVDRNRVAALHDWRGLHQSEAIRPLFGTWKTGERTIEKSIVHL